jgi:hypothetical protein
MTAQTDTLTAPRPARRADAGTVRLSQRDIDGLLLCGEHYGAPYDLLGEALQVPPERVPAIVARWRRAGYAATGRLGPGPAWCWLTRDGMTACGLGFPATRAHNPAAGRGGHVADAEIHWPSLPGSPYAGQVWAVEVELTPKPLARTTRIMAGLLSPMRYAQVIYLTAPPARPVVTRAIDALPQGEQPRMVARELPAAAFLPEAQR